MRRKLVLAALALFLTAAAAELLLPIPMPGDIGAYNTISRLYWCKTPYACLHEQGHALDQRLEWPSQSKAFSRAVEMYLIHQMRAEKPDEMAGIILDFPGLFTPAPRMCWDAKAELFATIYAMAQGDAGQIPDELREYFVTGAKQ